MVIFDKKRNLRKKDLLAEKKRLERLLYYYKKSPDEDIIIERQIQFINNELRVLAESKKK